MVKGWAKGGGGIKPSHVFCWGNIHEINLKRNIQNFELQNNIQVKLPVAWDGKFLERKIKKS